MDESKRCLLRATYDVPCWLAEDKEEQGELETAREESLEAGTHSSIFRLNVTSFCWMRWVHDFPPVY